jgi:8-oxo-dGTP pyrophosphatase MutT (NUDIX family)
MPEAEQQKHMRKEFSAGAVVVRRLRHQWWIAVIEPARQGNPEHQSGVVALPKGNVDPGESPEQTARREVLEETGLNAELLVTLGSIHYTYVRNWSRKEKIPKTVTFYLMKYRSGQIGKITPAMQHEVTRTYWMPLQEAVARLSYKEHRRIARQAWHYLRSQRHRLHSGDRPRMT